MKTPPFLLIGCPVLILIGAVVYFLTYQDLHRTPFHAALIQADSVTTTTNSGGGGHLREYIAKLDLTDAQRQQIEQIRQTMHDRTERRQAILKVLTDAQRAKLQQLRAQGQQAGGTTSSTNQP